MEETEGSWRHRPVHFLLVFVLRCRSRFQAGIMGPLFPSVRDRRARVEIEPLHEMQVRHICIDVGAPRLHAVPSVGLFLLRFHIVLMDLFVDLLVDQFQQRARVAGLQRLVRSGDRRPEIAPGRLQAPVSGEEGPYP